MQVTTEKPDITAKNYLTVGPGEYPCGNNLYLIVAPTGNSTAGCWRPRSKERTRPWNRGTRRSNSGIDGVLEVVDGSENAAFEAAIEEPGKESFGGVEQGRRGGREVEDPAWMLGEPL